MYAEADLLPLSGLQHLLFCERQCALIHVEQLWIENRLTAEGAILHRRAHEGKPETRDRERITRGLPLASFELGLSGKADIVLWRPPHHVSPPRSLAAYLRSAPLDGLAGWEITPIEYKRGRPKANDCDRVQLAAQARKCSACQSSAANCFTECSAAGRKSNSMHRCARKSARPPLAFTS